MIRVVPSDGKIKAEKELETEEAFAPESGCC